MDFCSIQHLANNNKNLTQKWPENSCVFLYLISLIKGYNDSETYKYSASCITLIYSNVMHILDKIAPHLGYKDFECKALLLS